MGEPRQIPPQEWHARLVRSRNWHLYQAGAARWRANEMLADVARHESEAELLEAQLQGLGLDPQPPFGPRPVPPSGGDAA